MVAGCSKHDFKSEATITKTKLIPYSSGYFSYKVRLKVNYQYEYKSKKYSNFCYLHFSDHIYSVGDTITIMIDTSGPVPESKFKGERFVIQ